MAPADQPAADARARLQASTRRGLLATMLGVVVSSVLAVIKVGAGILGHSYALVADGIESLLDIMSSMIVWGSLRIATQPANERFPYGYTKAEPLAGLAVATALFGAAIWITVHSIHEIRHPDRLPAPFTLVVLVLVVTTKEVLFRVLVRTGESIGSKAMQADAWHHRSDSLTSIAAFLGISIALWGGPGYESADDWAALFAAGVIVYNAARLFRSTWTEVLDVSAPEAVVQAIRDTAAAVEGVKAIDKCRVRRSGLALFVEIHVVVDGGISVREGHDLGHRVKDALLATDHGILDVAVHIEPF